MNPLCRASDSLTHEQMEALAIILEARRVSVSMVQRKMKCGYNKTQEICRFLTDSGLVDGIENCLFPAEKKPKKELTIEEFVEIVEKFPTVHSAQAIGLLEFARAVYSKGL